MTKVVTAGDPEVMLELEYGERKLTWKAEGILCQFSVKISELLRSAQSGTNLLQKPMVEPPIITQTNSQKRFTLSRVRRAVHLMTLHRRK